MPKKYHEHDPEDPQHDHLEDLFDDADAHAHHHHHDHDGHDHGHHHHHHTPDEVRKRARLYTLPDLLHFFPEVELPITVSDDDARIYSQHNDLLPGPLTFQFIVSYEATDPDGYTEYVPCFRLPTAQHYEAIVYWKAELLESGFYLATYNKEGRQISCQRIAGMRVSDDKVIQTVATIEASRQVYSAEGTSTTDLTGFDAAATRPSIAYISDDGLIATA